MRHDDHVVDPARRLPVPAVRHVEDVAADECRPDLGVVASIGVGVFADHAISAGGSAVDGYELAFAIAAIGAVVGGLVCAWRTSAHRDAVRLGLQKGVPATV